MIYIDGEPYEEVSDGVWEPKQASLTNYTIQAVRLTSRAPPKYRAPALSVITLHAGASVYTLHAGASVHSP